MGWKQIGNHSYYYRSRREGGQVVTEYVGGGESAEIIATLDAEEAEERRAEREADRAERERIEREESEADEWFRRTERIADLALLAAGFRKHRGQWRRQRNGGVGDVNTPVGSPV